MTAGTGVGRLVRRWCALMAVVILADVVLVVVILDDDGEDRCVPSGGGTTVHAPQAVAGGEGAYPTDKNVTHVSSPYGPRDGEFHWGIDLAGPADTPIFAFADGVVVNAADSGVQGFGGWVVIDHRIKGQQIQTVYGHMEPGHVYVGVGDRVTKGQHIADIGSAGQSSGPHLHFEVVDGDRAAGGQRVDPAPWLNTIGAGEPTRSSQVSPSGQSPGVAPTLGRNPNEGKEVPIGVSTNIADLDAFQLDNIRAIISIGKSRSEDPKVIKAALMAAGQEGGFRMLASQAVPESLSFPNDGVTAGDATSVGIFAIQTPMNGPVDKVMDRTWHINWFYDTVHRQADVSNEPWQIAADVERPREDLRWKYQNWEAMADELLATEGTIAPSQTTGCPPKDASGSGAIPVTASEFAKAAIEAARRQLGQPYVWGGGDASGPTGGTSGGQAGFDCSGLTLYAYAQASGGALVLPHYTGDTVTPGQMGAPGMADVPLDQIQPGDLVFFGSGGNAHHVGLAISATTMIHAPDFGQTVSEASISALGDLMAVKRPTMKQ